MTHIYKRKPNYYETDQMGIIHHSNYIRWLEEARISLMDEAGFALTTLESLDIQIPVLEVNCSYLKTVKFGDSMSVHVTVTEFTGVRMNFSYEIYNSKNELCTTAKTKHCFINPTGKVINLKKVLPRVYEIFENYYTVR